MESKEDSVKGGESKVLRVFRITLVVVICLAALALILVIPPKSIDIGSVYQGF